MSKVVDCTDLLYGREDMLTCTDIHTNNKKASPVVSEIQSVTGCC